MKKLSITLSDDVAEGLELASRRPGANKSAIIGIALNRLLNPERSAGDVALVRIDSLSRQLDIIDREIRIVTESLGLYIRYFLTITPPLPLPEQDAARALGRERFKVFVTQVG